MRATATCIAIVDLPEPPFSLPQTITCALRRRALPSEVPPTFANNMSPTPRPLRKLCGHLYEISTSASKQSRKCWLSAKRRLGRTTEMPASEQPKLGQLAPELGRHLQQRRPSPAKIGRR